MKKLTLLLIAAVLISGGVSAQHCCKKSGHCAKSSKCCKDKKDAKQEDKKDEKATAKPEAPKKA